MGTDSQCSYHFPSLFISNLSTSVPSPPPLYFSPPPSYSSIPKAQRPPSQGFGGKESLTSMNKSHF